MNSRDVARRAGLSQSTVSRVINGHLSVAPDLRRRVEAAMRDLGYVPNAAARSLVTRRSNVLGLLITNITNAFFAELVDAATARALERGYSVMLGVVPVTARGRSGMQRDQVQSMIGKGVDGLILTSALAGVDEDLAALVQDVPIVGVWPPSEVAIDTIAIDHRAGSRLATEHLLEHGRRRVLFLGGRRDSRAEEEHRSGHREALERAGLSPDETLISDGEFTYRSAYDRTANLLGQGLTVDAIATPADTMALGALDAIADAGMRVPRQVAVVGFDDIAAAGLRAVGLTTVRAFPAVLGAQAVDMLLDRASRTYDGPPRHVVVRPELVLRGTCGCDARRHVPSRLGA